MGETFGGAITSDFLSVYVSYANPLQQFCLAHLIRDIKYLTTLPDEKEKEFGEVLKKHFSKFFELWHQREDIPPDKLRKLVKRRKKKLYGFLLDSKFEKGKALNMKNRMIKHFDSLFQFFDNPELFQPTNNLAEQNLRHLIRIRRHSQGTKSAWGRLWIARFMTMFETCKKQDINSWDFLFHAIKAHKFNTKPLSFAF